MHWDGKPHGREVTFQEGAALARRMSKDAGCAVPFIETSAKYNVNVTSAFAGAFADQPASLSAMSSLLTHVCVSCVRGGYRAGTDGNAQAGPHGWHIINKSASQAGQAAQQVCALLMRETLQPTSISPTQGTANQLEHHEAELATTKKKIR
jgi:hypothetical protein